MKKYKVIVASLAIIIFLNGCQHDKPKPESGTKLINIKETESITVSNPIPENEPIFVQYHIKGRDIYIECIVKGMSFRKNSSGGKIAVFIDGIKQKEVYAAAFVLKGLSSGNHRMKMEVLTEKNMPYGKKKEFTITIP